MKELDISFNTTAKHLKNIKSWLIAEEKTGNKGFFCNWNVIEQSFNNKKIGVILEENKVIGFITWFDRDRITTIEIAEIRPGFRRMGYGRKLAQALFDNLQKQGVTALTLHCQPAESEKVWKRMDFKRYPSVPDFGDYNSEKGKWLYKILIPFIKPTKSIKGKESIELWSVEPYQIERVSPEWKWHPKFKKGTRTLIKPIVFPAKRDWNIRWKNNDGLIIRDEKVKRFGKDEIDFTNFIIIEKLPLP